RGRPPRREGAQGAGPRRAPDRARGGGPRRPRGRGGARLLRGGAQRDHRRWPAALGRLGSQARGPARGGRRQPRPGGGKGGMTRLLRRSRRLVADASDRTRDLRPGIRRAYGRVHGAARIPNDAAGLDAAAVARRFAGLVAIGRHRAKAGPLAGPGRSAPVARGPRRPRAAAPIPRPALPLPSRPASLPERDRAPALPAGFAVPVLLGSPARGAARAPPASVRPLMPSPTLVEVLR